MASNTRVRLPTGPPKAYLSEYIFDGPEWYRLGEVAKLATRQAIDVNEANDLTVAANDSTFRMAA